MGREKGATYRKGPGEPHSPTQFTKNHPIRLGVPKRPSRPTRLVASSPYQTQDPTTVPGPQTTPESLLLDGPSPRPRPRLPTDARREDLGWDSGLRTVYADDDHFALSPAGEMDANQWLVDSEKCDILVQSRVVEGSGLVMKGKREVDETE